MTIKEQQDSIIDEFSLFNDWTEKYEYIIQLGKNFPIDEHTKQTIILSGLPVEVWLHAELKMKVYLQRQRCTNHQGLVSMMVRVLSEQPPSYSRSSYIFIDG